MVRVRDWLLRASRVMVQSAEEGRHRSEVIVVALRIQSPLLLSPRNLDSVDFFPPSCKEVSVQMVLRVVFHRKKKEGRKKEAS